MIKSGFSTYLLILTHLILFSCCVAKKKCARIDGAVSSRNQLATDAGIAVLESGGTAADAAVAIQLVLSVIEPFGSGIGGGCFILYYDAKKKEVVSIDGREEAPTKFHPRVFCADDNCFTSPDGQPNANCQCDASTTLSATFGFQTMRVGGIGVGVPGTVAALDKLHKKYGKKKWKKLSEYAERHAEEGIVMYQQFYDSIQRQISQLGEFEDSKRLYLNANGTAPKAAVGEIWRNPDIVNTLKMLHKKNRKKVFYEGKIAKDIVEAVDAMNGLNPTTNRYGLLTEEDLAQYRAVFRKPIESTYKNFKVYGMGMPSSGGLTIALMLNILEKIGADYGGDSYSTDFLHHLISTLNLGFADRNTYMGDEDFVDVPVTELLQKEYAQIRANLVGTNAIPTPIPAGNPYNVSVQTLTDTTQGRGTTHFVVTDKNGNVASITSTVESSFGSFITVDGFILNNELTDFEQYPYVDDAQTVLKPNAPEGGKKKRKSALGKDKKSMGGKRPRSSMAPSIVLSNGKPVYALGSQGGATIIGTVYQTMLRMMDFGFLPQAAVNAARLWSFNSAFVIHEFLAYPALVPPNVQQNLNGRGYGVLVPRSFGIETALSIQQNGTVFVGADFQRAPQSGTGVLTSAKKCKPKSNSKSDSKSQSNGGGRRLRALLKKLMT